MKKLRRTSTFDGQAAMEYALLLGLIAIIVIIGFKTLLPRVHDASNVYFNKATNGIMGKPYTVPPMISDDPLFVP